MPVKENSESFAKNQLDTVIDNELDERERELPQKILDSLVGRKWDELNKNEQNMLMKRAGIPMDFIDDKKNCIIEFTGTPLFIKGHYNDNSIFDDKIPIGTPNKNAVIQSQDSYEKESVPTTDPLCRTNGSVTTAMKEYKLKVLNKMEQMANHYHSVSLRAAALAVGVNHLTTQEAHEVMNAFCLLHPTYSQYKLSDNSLDSFFCSAFVSDNKTPPSKEHLESVTQDKPENYLKNAEMMIEDDYDSIDGIINNGSKSEELKKLQTNLNQEKEYAPISRKQIKSNADRIAHQEQLKTNDLNRSKGQALE